MHDLSDRVLHPCFAVRTLYLHEGMPYIIIMEHYNYNIIICNSLDMSQPTVVCLTSVRSVGIGMASVESTSVGHQSRDAELKASFSASFYNNNNSNNKNEYSKPQEYIFYFP